MKLPIYLACLGLVLISCAKVGNPSGGDKDESPPEILKSSPSNFSLNIHPKEISIEFDEYVVLGNYENEWTVTPPLSEKPKAKLKGKTLIIELPDSLEDNTTYTFNFGESIKDLHEGNILKDNLFVFSTGAFLDSGKVAGTTLLASEGTAAKEITVGLFESPIDSLPPKSEARYITKSKEDGSFSFSYVKDGTYRLFAWEDKNRNKIIEDSEARAFLDSAVSTQDSSLHQLNVFQEAPDSLVIEKETLRENLNVLLKFNMELPEDASVSSDSVAYIDQEADSLNIWYQQTRNVDSVLVVFKSTDSTRKTLSFYPFDLSRKTASKLVLSEIIKPEVFDPCFAAYNKPSAIVPIPLHPRKLALRGFNQAEAIAHCLSAILKIPSYPQLLQRQQFNKSQTKNNKYERHKLSSNLFIRVDTPPNSIILVDDVVTTGATLHSAIDCFPISTDIAIFTLARA